MKRLGRLMLAWAVVALALAASSGGAQASPALSDYTGDAQRALAWMQTQQQADGSFAGFGAGSTVDAVLAIVAGGGKPVDYVRGGNNPVSFLESKAATLSKSAGGAGKLLIASNALGLDSRSFGGVDLVAAVNATFGISATAQYGPDVIGHAFAVIGLSAVGQQVPVEALDRLVSLQTGEGGWSFSGSTGPGAADTNTTSVVIQAFASADALTRYPGEVKEAMAYLAAQQNPDGGWPYQKEGEFGGESDANSTAYAVQAMLTLGNTTLSERGQRYLLTLQRPSGSFRYQQSMDEDNPGATYQAVPALLGATLLNTTPRPLPEPDVVGMPRTGGADLLPLGAMSLVLAAMAALAALAGGFALKRAR